MAATARIFTAVFPPASDSTLPTPTGTPVIGSSTGVFSGDAASSFNDASGGRSLGGGGGGAAEQIRWDRAWHTATSFLLLPAETIRAEEGEDRIKRRFLKQYQGSDGTTEVRKATEYLLSENSRGRQLRIGSAGQRGEDLLQWYFEDVVVRHFVGYMLPFLVKKLEDDPVPDGVFNVGKHLYVCQMVYLSPVETLMRPHLPRGKFADPVHSFKRDVKALFSHTLPRQGVDRGLKTYFLRQASLTLDVNRNAYMEEGGPLSDSNLGSDQIVQKLREETCIWASSLHSVGLGGHHAERIFAEVMMQILQSHIRNTCARSWNMPSTNPQQICNWIAGDFATFIAVVLENLEDETPSENTSQMEDRRADVEKWQEMGINILGALRSEELFDIVIEWDDQCQGAIEDLKLYVKTATSRAYLTNTFSKTIEQRLLKPSAATNEILQVYISIIQAFTLLDSRGVLLDRVARPIRWYLRDRETTVSIVLEGLLADPEQKHLPDGVLIELSLEMARQNNLLRDAATTGELDFDDMQWQPDPVDAGPEFKLSKHSDIIGSMISLFESKDVFVGEFQNILGERLLKREHRFDREIRVLELLKIRFGEASLQACEVMLRDIMDSRRVDASIQKDTDFGTMGDDVQIRDDNPNFYARILSHLYWPALHAESFEVPAEIAQLQQQYEAGFEKIKQSRKLTWLHALGQVTVSLDLEDRTVTEEVQTWQASVIYAFQPTDAEDPTKPVTRSISQLGESLSMAESLVLRAVTFWVGKLVLKRLSPAPSSTTATTTSSATYIVLETLSDEPAAQSGTISAAIAAAAEAVTASAAPAVLNEHEVAQEKMDMYAQYVTGMLTNGGAMPLAQIVMMLKMTVPGGFPVGNEELQSYLEGQVRSGKLEFQSGNYKIKH